MADGQLLSMERIDPLLVNRENDVDQTTLQLHLERYEFAARFVADRRVVDCACGTGYGSELLAQAGAAEVIGVDICPDAVAFAQRNYIHERVSYHTGDALTFTAAQVPEVWVTLETVEHLENPEPYLRSVHRRLAPGGLLIASVPTTVSTDGNPYHLHDFTQRSWRKLVSRCGFAIESELMQTHRFALRDVFGKDRGPRQQSRRSLLGFYLRHPRVLLARAGLTLTRGLVNEYLIVCARRIT